MRETRTKFILLVVLLATLFVPRAVAQTSTTVTETHEIQMTAKKYQFSPNPITVKKGEHVKLVITALDRNHGFKLSAYKIKQELKKGQPTTIEFVADQAGTFPFECSDFCGIGHPRMKGKLVVQDK